MTRREFLQQAINKCLDLLDDERDHELIPEAIHLDIDWTDGSSDTFKLIVVEQPTKVQ